MKRFLLFLFIVFIIALCVGGVALTWGYFYITRDLPNLSTIEDYKPDSVSAVYAANGELIAEFFQERRYPVPIEDVPIFARNAFLAAEDASFYKHPGIDIQSIFRAFLKNLQTGSIKQGGSTITQQVVKNLLLSSERKLERKIKEAILSYRLEQRLSKDDILEMYLNQIYFGNAAYGIKAATWLYFRKQLEELTLAEAAMLAGLPKAPSRYSPISNYPRAKQRQEYVLDQMVKAGFVTQAAAENARAEDVKVYKARTSNIYQAPYYVTEVRRIFAERWPELDLDSDGLKVHTAVDVKAYNMADSALRRGLHEVDRRRGWRGPLKQYEFADSEAFAKDFSVQIPDELEKDRAYPALVVAVGTGKTIRVQSGVFQGSVNLDNSRWAKKFRDSEDSVKWIEPQQVLREGDVIEVSYTGDAEIVEEGGEVEGLELAQTPDIQGALVLVDPLTGKVPVIIGGYSYQKSVFNRATQGKRQPGSGFKPVVYLAAIDGFGYTPATIVYDSPRSFRVGEEYWEPNNYDEKYLGPLTLRTALEKSRNLISADIISRIGVDAAIQYARKLGINSRLGRNLSLSLGSSEVTPIEITRAYGVFAAKGVLFESIFVTRIEDRKGNVLYDYEQDVLGRASQAINENSAFIIANMMKGVVEHGTGYKVRAIKRPVAGKTGTSNDQMDAWFLGYTPNWATGVWVGFDQKKTIGPKETGGRVAAPIWLDFMSQYLEYQETRALEELRADAKAEADRLGIEFVEPEVPGALDFSVPDGVDPFWIYKKSGTQASEGAPGAILEYFLRGTEPSVAREEEELPTSYLESGEL